MTFKALSPAEMRKLAEAAEKHWSRVDIMLGGNPIGTDEVSPFVAACSPSQILHDADLIEAQGKEIADLKQSVIAFCAPWAVTHARQSGLPDGHLHPAHYDLLERCGARMVDFTRALLTPEGAQP